MLPVKKPLTVVITELDPLKVGEPGVNVTPCVNATVVELPNSALTKTLAVPRPKLAFMLALTSWPVPCSVEVGAVLPASW